ncbi:MAG: glycerophosphodiester phosphodiesterase [Sphingobium sp.]
MRWSVILSLASLAMTAPALASPIVIAHRGASGERPEHTIASYTLAIEQGADFIEPDLVMTKDGVLVARHENEISGTTDVADHPEFAARKAKKTIDGQSVSGWFTEDFTLAELKTLRAKERLPMLRPGNAAYDGRFDIPTFQEIMDLARAKEKETGRRIGLYPETKHPSYFRSIGLALEEPLAALLAKNGYTTKDDPVFIQSFELENLKTLRGLTGLRLIFLMDAGGGPADGAGRTYAALATPAGLAEVARTADGIGPSKEMIVPRTMLGRSGEPTDLVRDAHAAGLKVHVWTFRAENYFLPLELRKGVDPRKPGDLTAEIRQFAALGVDGVFSDFPGIAVAALKR